MARLDLIQFKTGTFGLQEVDDRGTITALWDHEADYLALGRRASTVVRTWTVVRTLAQGEAYDPDAPDDFWRALAGVAEITPAEPY